MPKKKNSWKTNINENKAPKPPCGERHPGKCHISDNCSLKVNDG